MSRGSFTTNSTNSPTTVAVTGFGDGDLIFPIGTQFTGPPVVSSGITYTSVADLDTQGLAFDTTAGTITIFSLVAPNSSPSEATGNFYGETGGGLPFGVGHFDLTPTPLPATLPLLAGGLGFVGYLAKRRKQNTKQALAAA